MHDNMSLFNVPSILQMASMEGSNSTTIPEQLITHHFFIDGDGSVFVCIQHFLYALGTFESHKPEAPAVGEEIERSASMRYM